MPEHHHDRRLRQLRRLGRLLGIAGGCIAAVLAFALIPAGTSDWDWPPRMFGVLLGADIVALLVWVITEAIHWAVEALRPRRGGGYPGCAGCPGNGPQLVTVGDLTTGASAPGAPAASLPGSGAPGLSDEALRGYFLGLHDREQGTGGPETVA